MRINKRALRRMENLKEICDFDVKTKTATVHIRYKNANEIIESSLSGKEAPVINTDAVEYIEHLLNIIPRQFAVRVCLTIEDYQGYQPQQLKKAYDSHIQSIDYSEDSMHNKKKIIMISFVLISAVFLFGYIVAKKNNWFEFMGKGVALILLLLIDLVFEVCFEEGFVFFAVTRQYNKIVNNNYKRMKDIILM